MRKNPTNQKQRFRIALVPLLFTLLQCSSSQVTESASDGAQFYADLDSALAQEAFKPGNIVRGIGKILVSSSAVEWMLSEGCPPLADILRPDPQLPAEFAADFRDACIADTQAILPLHDADGTVIKNQRITKSKRTYLILNDTQWRPRVYYDGAFSERPQIGLDESDCVQDDECIGRVRSYKALKKIQVVDANTLLPFAESIRLVRAGKVELDSLEWMAKVRGLRDILLFDISLRDSGAPLVLTDTISSGMLVLGNVAASRIEVNGGRADGLDAWGEHLHSLSVSGINLLDHGVRLVAPALEDVSVQRLTGPGDLSVWTARNLRTLTVDSATRVSLTGSHFTPAGLHGVTDLGLCMHQFSQDTATDMREVLALARGGIRVRTRMCVGVTNTLIFNYAYKVNDGYGSGINALVTPDFVCYARRVSLKVVYLIEERDPTIVSYSFDGQSFKAHRSEVCGCWWGGNQEPVCPGSRDLK